MNKEERVKLVFETISKIAGFEIKPNKAFYMVVNGEKGVYQISESLNLYCKAPNGYYSVCKAPDGYYMVLDYNIILQVFNDWYQFEEIKEPFLAFEEKEFLSQFEFEWLEISTTLDMFDKNNELVASINLNNVNINLSFDGLEKNRKYSGKELGL